MGLYRINSYIDGCVYLIYITSLVFSQLCKRQLKLRILINTHQTSIKIEEDQTKLGGRTYKTIKERVSLQEVREKT